MFADHKVVACIPAGRQRTMKPLMQHLRANSHIIDEVQMWENVRPFDDHTQTTSDDLDWIHAQADGFARVVPLDDDEPPRKPKQLNTGRFYRHTTEANTLYIRFDDDVVWIAPDAIENLLTLRLAEPKPFVVFATIWNNAIISAIAQELGTVNGDFGHIDRYCMDDVGWKLPEFGEYIHRTLLAAIESDTVDRLTFDHVPAITLPRGNRPDPTPMRFSVSCFTWTGEDMSVVADELWTAEEEQFISSVYPERTGRFNLIAGNALVSHYSFFTQRAHLDTTDILTQYQDLADDAYHDAYYRLLDNDS